MTTNTPPKQRLFVQIFKCPHCNQQHKAINKNRNRLDDAKQTIIDFCKQSHPIQE